MSMKGLVSGICGFEKNKGTTITKQEQTHRYKLVVSGVEKGWGKGQNGWRRLKGTTMYKISKLQRSNVQHKGYSQYFIITLYKL